MDTLHPKRCCEVPAGVARHLLAACGENRLISVGSPRPAFVSRYNVEQVDQGVSQ